MRLTFRIVVAALLAAATLQTLRLGYADYLFHRDSASSVREAARIVPGNAVFEARLADLDPSNAIAHLRSAVARDPGLSKAWIQLGLQLEMQGNTPEAERSFLEAARRDRQFLPAWTLANYYARRNDATRFWPWAQQAASMSYDDISPLLRLAFGFTDMPEVVLREMIVPRHKVEREFLYYLLHSNVDATCAASRLLEHPSKDDLPPLLAWDSRLIEKGRIAAAIDLWNTLSDRHLIHYQHAEGITNPDFAHESLQSGFDWRIEPPDGVAITRSSSGLRVEFSGRQAETCEIASQYLAAGKGAYLLTFEYRTAGIPVTTGLRWWIAEANSDAIPASEDWRTGRWTFIGAQTNRLILVEQRERGATRPEGTVYLRNVHLSPIQNSTEKLK